MLYSFVWVLPWHLNFICRRFGTFCLLHLPRLCKTPGYHLNKEYNIQNTVKF